ncbi:hypothetical protein MKW94_022168 [Papaver nudicaule]|uniref:At3g05675-like ankyrin-like domain-containing protein n=1 Tax=Papaver nudicaule TaxID=74823 RepID=A0AA41VAP1_PAPNU|nr:hypothetical protein [Papaver nudicaule]
MILKTDRYEGRRQAQSLVLKLLRENNDVNSAEAFNKYLLSSSRSCLSSLLNLFKQSQSLFYTSRDVDKKISLEATNLLWLLDVLRDRRAAEEFALMWANQQKLANLHVKSKTPDRDLISLITIRLLVGIGNGEILPAKKTKQLLLLTWFRPLLDDYSSLRQYRSIDPKEAEENIERAILELIPEDQLSILFTWYECFLKKGDSYPDLRKAFEGWCRGSFGKRPTLSLSRNK